MMLLFLLNLAVHPAGTPAGQGDASVSLVHPETLFLWALVWKPWGSGTLTDHDAGERQDKGGHQGRGHDGEDQRERQVGFRGG